MTRFMEIHKGQPGSGLAPQRARPSETERSLLVLQELELVPSLVEGGDFVTGCFQSTFQLKNFNARFQIKIRCGKVASRSDTSLSAARMFSSIDSHSRTSFHLGN